MTTKPGAIRHVARGVVPAILVLAAGGCAATTNSVTPPSSSHALHTTTPFPAPPSSHPPSLPVPVGDLRARSVDVPCAAGTRDIGLDTGYYRGRPVRLRLCVVSELASSAPESTRGSPYFLPGATGRAVVNSRVSAAVSALAVDAHVRGVDLQVSSAYRSMRHQQQLCAQDAGCSRGDHRLVAPPGWSNHQLGLAFDVAGTGVEGARSCTTGRAVDPTNVVWSYLTRHAARFGYHQYSAESWHWDPARGVDRC